MTLTLVGLLILTHLAAFVGGMFAHHFFATKAIAAAQGAADAAKKL